GPMWNFEVRKKANATAKSPRVAVAGPLISSVSREKLDLGDPPIVKIDTPDQAREFVRKLAEQKPDLVKIWYIVDKDHPVDSFRPIVRATIQESHAHKIRVAVHATELEDRKSTRLNSSHVSNSYAVFCLKKKKITKLIKLVKTLPILPATQRRPGGYCVTRPTPRRIIDLH